MGQRYPRSDGGPGFDRDMACAGKSESPRGPQLARWTRNVGGANAPHGTGRAHGASAGECEARIKIGRCTRADMALETIGDTPFHTRPTTGCRACSPPRRLEPPARTRDHRGGTRDWERMEVGAAARCANGLGFTRCRPTSRRGGALPGLSDSPPAPPSECRSFRGRSRPIRMARHLSRTSGAIRKAIIRHFHFILG